MTQLASYFKGVSAKLLSAVEVQRSSSNQHELNGTVAMKGYFGEEKKQFSAQFIYIGSHDNDRLTLNASVTLSYAYSVTSTSRNASGPSN